MAARQPFFVRLEAALLFVVIVFSQMLFANVTDAKEYNRSTYISPEQRVKVDKAIAKSRALADVDVDADTLLSEGETNVGCGELAIGNIDTGDSDPKYGLRPVTVDRDIIITGDVINVATGCNRTSDD